MSEQTTAAYSAAIPPAPTSTLLTWATLVEANPSLRSWERSAATAGSKGLVWWCRWASSSGQLRRDVSDAVGHEARPDVFYSALGIAQRKISDTCQAAAQQAREREAAELRRQATPQGPYPTGIPPRLGVLPQPNRS
jgi:hypothetical protein